MCTSIGIINANSVLFGRNMDIEHSFNEKIIFVPRNYNIVFKKEKSISSHHKIMGVGAIIDDYPLFADAINEYGLYFSGLNFPEFCKYNDVINLKKNYAPYEVCLFILATCKSVKEVIKKLKDINIVDIPFSSSVLNTPLHFMIGDKKESICVESLEDGLKIHNNPFNVLTNNPPFTYHKENIKNYINMHTGDAINKINKKIDLKPYSNGTGAMFLPGDFSSSSRFIKAFFVKSNVEKKNDKLFNIIQFFNVLDSVKMPLGCVRTRKGLEYTRYSNCYDLLSCELYYKTYFSNEIIKISLNGFDQNISKIQSLEFNKNYVIISDN